MVPIGQVEINKADENFVNQVVDIVNANISDPAFNVEVLTTKMCMSHSNFSKKLKGIVNMSFFTSAIDVLQTLVIALGGGLCVWGGINLLEGYGQDNPASKSQGIKQFMAN